MPVALINARSRELVEPRLPGGIEAVWFHDEDELLALAHRAEIAWLDPVKPAIAAQAIASAEKLAWLSVMSSGVDWLPLDILEARGVTLTNGAGIHAQSVAEYAILGMLAMAKDWRSVVQAQERHEWLSEPPGKRELLDAQVLVMGAGEIGARIAEILKVLGAQVTMMRAHPGDGDLSPLTYEAELARFDWVVVIVPSTPETRGMIGARQFAAMKPGAIFVNFARGTVIDQEALVAALEAGHLGGAFLDVTTPEPLPSEHPLWGMPNVHISMHLSGRAQDQLLVRGAARFVKNCERFVTGEALAHRIDFSRGY